MSNILLTRLEQGYRTMKYPRGLPPPLSDRFRGRPLVDPAKCQAGCASCVSACPSGALERKEGEAPRVDLGKCLFCTDCQRACPQAAIGHSGDYRLATRDRGSLKLSCAGEELALAEQLDRKARRLFGHSLKLRQVSAGGCAACECDVNVLGTIGWDLGRFGISFVASPRHADALFVTGPVTPNMALALKKTYDAVAEPRLVIVSGACAISGGPYADPAIGQCGVDQYFKVDLYIPGCPPHPLTVLDGLLRLLGRLEEKKA